jgi:hypothetical protein
MHELTGKLAHSLVTYSVNGKPVVTLELNERMLALSMVDSFKDVEKLSIKIDKYREKRSLNANNYAWKLITEIGNATRIGKDEVYLKMLKRYGQSEMVSAMAHIPFGQYVKYYEEAGESELNGKLFKHYRVYKGSSEFDTMEMSIFIDGIVSEAQELGIPTDTPEQIARMKDLWG